MTAGSIAVPNIVALRAPIGKPKNVIDIYTPIEIRTDTPNAEVFFTIDGSKPDPFAALGADRSTIKYTKPFRLKEGRFNVKAIAVSKDGARESNVMTKNFEVERSDEKENRHHHHEVKTDYDFIDDLERERKKEILKKRGILKKIVDTNTLSFRSDGASLSDNESSRVHHHHHHSHPHHQKHGMLKTTTLTSFEHDIPHGGGDMHIAHKKIHMPDSSVQTLRLQRETDFLRCAFCFALRPNDPMAKYCAECGKTLPMLPQYKIATPENGRLGTCFFCKSTVPLNTSICVICENPIQPQLQPQAAVKLQGKITCPGCLSQNPASYTTCMICECKLPPGAKVHPVDLSVVVPQHPVPAGKSYTCGQCFRINRSDARFCDWCGAKPRKEIGPVQCNRCGTGNNPYAKFCSSCGNIIQSGSSSGSLFAKSTSQAAWLSHIDSKANHILNKEYATVSTQTYGLYYASAKSLENKYDKEEKTLRMERDFLEKRPPLTAVSAGRGYWRQQLDHICAHLKAFTHNDADFRATVSEPRLGRLSLASVHVDSNYCTIIAKFPVRSKDSFNSSSTHLDTSSKNGKAHLTQNDYDMMAAVVEGRGSSLDEDSVTESDSYRSESSKTKKKKKKRPPTDKHQDKLSGEDRQLLKEIGKSGKGRPNEVEALVKEGANPNVKNPDGLSALFCAIRNRHYDCVPVLIRNHADVKTRCPPKDNSLLHETVLQGPEASILIKMLIENGVNPNWKNSKNETAFDLAIKENNSAAVNILGANVGDNMIEAYLKTKSNDIKP